MCSSPWQVGLRQAESSHPISLNKAVQAKPSQTLWEKQQSLAQGFAQRLPAGHREVGIGLYQWLSLKSVREKEKAVGKAVEVFYEVFCT